MTRFFDFVNVEDGIFVASHAHTARFKACLTKGDFNGESRTLSLSNGIVNLVYKDLLKLQDILTSEVYRKEGSRPRTPAAMGG